MMASESVAGSFRDPSGFLFRRDGVLYRQVNATYRSAYDTLMGSGLYDALVKAELLVPHEEVDVPPADPTSAYKIIRPEPIPFVSYPYEWCFGQLKDAALATLKIQESALQHDMSLKDASAYNIQFRGGRGPVLIDTLSFEPLREGAPWVAYRQFCQHFLAPLALMARVDVRMGSLLRVHMDGVPLDLASRLLPWGTRYRPGLAAHLHLHARSLRRHADAAVETQGRSMSRFRLKALFDSLRRTVERLTWNPDGTEWSDYYDETNYSRAGAEDKRRTVESYLDRLNPGTVWDLGGNIGRYSRLASSRGAYTVCVDGDLAAVEKAYQEASQPPDAMLLPLVNDLSNPSPGLGWAHTERQSLAERGPADLVMALALVHHLAIGNNVPLGRLADAFADLGRHLIVEFVPKEDDKVQGMLRNREDVFPTYTLDGFRQAFTGPFEVLDEHPIAGSARTLLLMQRRP
jgi:hypothetical protein